MLSVPRQGLASSSVLVILDMRAMVKFVEKRTHVCQLLLVIHNMGHVLRQDLDYSSVLVTQGLRVMALAVKR
jgi:hypothetical protein